MNKQRKAKAASIIITRICEHCDKEYQIDNSRRNWQQKLCSVDCLKAIAHAQQEIFKLAFDADTLDPEAPFRARSEFEQELSWEL